MGDLPLVRIDIPAHRAWLGSRELHLTPLQFRVAALLTAEAGKNISAERLIRRAWNTEWMGPRKTLHMHVSHLRLKLGDDAANPRYIVTAPSLGYRFEPEMLDPASVFDTPDPATAPDAMGLVDQLADMIANLDKHIQERAEQIATPLIAAARTEVDETVAAAERDVAGITQRWQDLEVELRRQITYLQAKAGRTTASQPPLGRQVTLGEAT